MFEIFPSRGTTSSVVTREKPQVLPTGYPASEARLDYTAELNSDSEVESND